MAPVESSRDDSRTLRWISGEDLAKVRGKSVMVVGCGGIGSLFTLFAAQLGIETITIADDDVVELSNLNRFISAASGDVGRRKVDVVYTDLRRRLPGCTLRVIPDRFPSEPLIRVMAEHRPLVVGCLDAVKPRVELDIACRRFGLTYLDIGTGFKHNDNDGVVSSGGQVLMSRAGAACIMCMGFRNVADARGYAVPGVDVPAASILTLNAVVAAMGLEMVTAEATGTSLTFNVLRFDRGSLDSQTEFVAPEPDCRICGANNDSVSAILPEW
jgi:ThiF family